MKRIAMTLVVAFAVAGCATGGTQEPQPATSEPAAPPAASTAPSPPAGACRYTYPSTPLPEWAESGFSEAEPSVPHVLSDKGDMAAIVWASQHPLASPPAADKGNKILWVARIGAADGPLEIRATSEDTGQTVSRTVEPAPGPSIIDLPSPGCWSLELTWGRHHDHLQLGYVPG